MSSSPDNKDELQPLRRSTRKSVVAKTEEVAVTPRKRKSTATPLKNVPDKTEVGTPRRTRAAATPRKSLAENVSTPKKNANTKETPKKKKASPPPKNENVTGNSPVNKRTPRKSRARDDLQLGANAHEAEEESSKVADEELNKNRRGRRKSSVIAPLKKKPIESAMDDIEESETTPPPEESTNLDIDDDKSVSIISSRKKSRKSVHFKADVDERQFESDDNLLPDADSLCNDEIHIPAVEEGTRKSSLALVPKVVLNNISHDIREANPAEMIEGNTPVNVPNTLAETVRIADVPENIENFSAMESQLDKTLLSPKNFLNSDEDESDSGVSTIVSNSSALRAKTNERDYIRNKLTENIVKAEGEVDFPSPRRKLSYENKKDIEDKVDNFDGEKVLNLKDSPSDSNSSSDEKSESGSTPESGIKSIKDKNALLSSEKDCEDSPDKANEIQGCTEDLKNEELTEVSSNSVDGINAENKTFNDIEENVSGSSADATSSTEDNVEATDSCVINESDTSKINLASPLEKVNLSKIVDGDNAEKPPASSDISNSRIETTVSAIITSSSPIKGNVDASDSSGINMTDTSKINSASPLEIVNLPKSTDGDNAEITSPSDVSLSRIETTASDIITSSISTVDDDPEATDSSVINVTDTTNINSASPSEKINLPNNTDGDNAEKTTPSSDISNPEIETNSSDINMTDTSEINSASPLENVSLPKIAEESIPGEASASSESSNSEMENTTSGIITSSISPMKSNPEETGSIDLNVTYTCKSTSSSPLKKVCLQKTADVNYPEKPSASSEHCTSGLETTIGSTITSPVKGDVEETDPVDVDMTGTCKTTSSSPLESVITPKIADKDYPEKPFDSSDHSNSGIEATIGPTNTSSISPVKDNLEAADSSKTNVTDTCESTSPSSPEKVSPPKMAEGNPLIQSTSSEHSNSGQETTIGSTITSSILSAKDYLEETDSVHIDVTETCETISHCPLEKDIPPKTAEEDYQGKESAVSEHSNSGQETSSAKVTDDKAMPSSDKSENNSFLGNEVQTGVMIETEMGSESVKNPQDQEQENIDQINDVSDNINAKSEVVKTESESLVDSVSSLSSSKSNFELVTPNKIECIEDQCKNEEVIMKPPEEMTSFQLGGENDGACIINNEPAKSDNDTPKVCTSDLKTNEEYFPDAECYSLDKEEAKKTSLSKINELENEEKKKTKEDIKGRLSESNGIDTSINKEQIKHNDLDSSISVKQEHQNCSLDQNNVEKSPANVSQQSSDDKSDIKSIHEEVEGKENEMLCLNQSNVAIKVSYFEKIEKSIEKECISLKRKDKKYKSNDSLSSCLNMEVSFDESEEKSVSDKEESFSNENATHQNQQQFININEGEIGLLAPKAEGKNIISDEKDEKNEHPAQIVKKSFPDVSDNRSTENCERENKNNKIVLESDNPDQSLGESLVDSKALENDEFLTQNQNTDNTETSLSGMLIVEGREAKEQQKDIKDKSSDLDSPETTAEQTDDITGTEKTIDKHESDNKSDNPECCTEDVPHKSEQTTEKVKLVDKLEGNYIDQNLSTNIDEKESISKAIIEQGDKMAPSVEDNDNQIQNDIDHNKSGNQELSESKVSCLNESECQFTLSWVEDDVKDADKKLEENCTLPNPNNFESTKSSSLELEQIDDDKKIIGEGNIQTEAITNESNLSDDSKASLVHGHSKEKYEEHKAINFEKSDCSFSNLRECSDNEVNEECHIEDKERQDSKNSLLEKNINETPSLSSDSPNKDIDKNLANQKDFASSEILESTLTKLVHNEKSADGPEKKKETKRKTTGLLGKRPVNKDETVITKQNKILPKQEKKDKELNRKTDLKKSKEIKNTSKLPVKGTLVTENKKTILLGKRPNGSVDGIDKKKTRANEENQKLKADHSAPKGVGSSSSISLNDIVDPEAKEAEKVELIDEDSSSQLTSASDGLDFLVGEAKEEKKQWHTNSVENLFNCTVAEHNESDEDDCDWLPPSKKSNNEKTKSKELKEKVTPKTQESSKLRGKQKKNADKTCEISTKQGIFHVSSDKLTETKKLKENNVNTSSYTKQNQFSVVNICKASSNKSQDENHPPTDFIAEDVSVDKNLLKSTVPSMTKPDEILHCNAVLPARLTKEEITKAFEEVGIKDIISIEYTSTKVVLLQFSTKKSLKRALTLYGQIKYKDEPIYTLVGKDVALK